MTAEEQFDDLRAALADRVDVSVPSTRGFGRGALCANDHIFAMVTRDHLVVKLPARRVQELIAGGLGKAFDAGKGRPMKEWVMLGPDADSMALGREALAFAVDSPKSKR